MTSEPRIPRNDLVCILNAKINETLQPLLPSRALCALLDFPNHNNVGDSAIWFVSGSTRRSSGICGCNSRCCRTFIPEAPRHARTACTALGKEVSERALFVIDATGVIRRHYLAPSEVNPGVDWMLTALEALGQRKEST